MTASRFASPRKANFFLVGAPKAGTTSLDRFLRQHPDVFLSPIKEPCHFCPDVVAQLAPRIRAQPDVTSYLASPPAQRPLMHMCVVASPEQYAHLYDGADRQSVVGECSTFYLSSSSAAGAIHAYNPDARIVVMARDPMSRIRSHYAMDCSLGLAERALPLLVEDELALGAQADWGNSSYYVGATRYARQVSEYLRYFPADQLFISSFEQLVADPDRELRRLFAFLGIAPPADPMALPCANKSRAVRFPRLHRALRESGLKPLVARLVRRGLDAPLGRTMKSMYYREKAPLVPEADLARLAVLLQDAGLDEPLPRVGETPAEGRPMDLCRSAQ